MHKVVYTLDGKKHTFLLAADRVTVGRMEGNDLVLRDHTVSRAHAELRREGARWKVVDLGSRNGTLVNGNPVRESPLKAGDILSFGTVEAVLEEEGESRVYLTENGALPGPSEGTIVRSLEEVQALLEAPAKQGAARRDVPAGDRQARVAAIFTALADLAKTLIGATEVEEVLRKVLDVIFLHVQAQRGVILLQDPGGGDLRPRVVRQAGGEEEAIQISQTISKKVFEEGVAILSSDAQVDPRFEAGHSIRFLGIRSALCVPLATRERVLGLIYVDTPLKVRAFSDFDLDLLSTLAGYSAMAIHQADLRARIQEEREARNRLQRYHSPEVVSRILDSARGPEGAALDVREVEATVLFADLVGFTSMSESMAPRDVALLLNDVFSQMTEVIFRHEGTLDKFIGDCIMAIFGAPLARPDHARRAVDCAREMRQALDDFNRERAGSTPLRFRIGINTGRVVAGDIGSLRRMEYTVLGDTVNLAARLQSEVAQPGQIVAGEATWDGCGPGCETWKKIEHVAVKGLSRTVTAYEVA